MIAQKVSCIYQIINSKTNKCYIGSSRSYSQRKSYHLYHLRNNKHHSIKLQNAWNKYGEINFTFVILEHCDPIQLLIREQYYIDLYKPEYIVLKKAGRPTDPNFYVPKKPRNNDYNNVKIIAYNVNGDMYKIFNSMKDASFETGDSTKVISKCCIELGEISRKSRKYIYRYYTEDYQSKIVIKERGKKTRPFIDTCPAGNITQWTTLSAAANYYKCNRSTIYKALTKKIKNCLGRQWEYIN